MKNPLLYLTLIVFASACVPARQLEEMTSKKEMLEAENQELKTAKQDLESRLAECETNYATIKEKHDELVQDTTEFGIRFRQIKEQYDKLNELNDMLASKNSSLIREAADENRKLLEELEQTRLELQAQEDALDAKEKNLQTLNAELEEREKRLTEMQELLSRQEEASNALKDKISNALLGFQDKGLSVYQKNGKVYVGMEANLLFPSGSTKINEEGKKALIDLANAIQDQGDLEIIVEGHTDTDKISSNTIPRDNWELSVLRATAVVKIMTENSTVDPKILSAAGRSEYLPVDPEDKAKNRRIEVIISPNLDELYEVIEQK